MVKYVDVIRVINTKLKDKFPTVKIASSDTEEGIVRPSFMVSLDNIKESNFMKSLYNSIHSCILYASTICFNRIKCFHC